MSVISAGKGFLNALGVDNLLGLVDGKTVKELVELGYPEEVAEKIADGTLKMDEVSRQSRSNLMNMNDQRLYRGHDSGRPPHSNQDMFMSDSYDNAFTYADAYKYGDVTPLRHNADNLAYVNAGGKHDRTVTTNNIKNPGIRRGVIRGTDEISEAVKYSDEYQGTHFKGIRDDMNNTSSTERANVYNILGSRDDVQIRHADLAAFDPDYKGSNIMGFADPKLLAGTAAGTAGLLGLMASEDADAGVSSFFRHAPDAARTFAGRVPGDGKAPNPKQGRTRSGLPTQEAAAKLATDLDDAIKNGASQKDLELLVGNFIHGDTDYNQWVRRMGEIDGGKDGAAYLTGTDIVNEELKELLPERHHGLIDSYTQFRLGPKEQGRPWTKAAGLESKAGEGFGDKAYYDSLWEETTAPQAPANSAMADALKKAAVEETPRRSKVDRSNLKKGLLGGGGAAGAGSANSQELGFREWPTAPVPTSPEERGFGQPLPTYDELMAEKNRPLPLPTGGDVVDSIFSILGMPMTGLQGTARGLFGLATGEGLAGAAAQAANTMDVGWNNGRSDVRGINPDKGANQFEGYVTDVTGDPSLGWMAKMGLMLGGI